MTEEEWNNKNCNRDGILFDKEFLRQRGLITTGFHLPYKPKLKQRARELRKNMRKAEKKLWYGYLRNFKYRVLRQRPIDNYIVDFYRPQLRLVIEIDGEIHFIEEGKVYDTDRTGIFESYGLRVIRFSNIDIFESFEGVCQRLEEEIPPPPLNPPLVRGE